jgi:hypothetical protein
MLKYSELSLAQKKVIDKMKSGIELQFNGDFFQFADGEFVKRATANSLFLRHFILECYRNKDNFSVYAVNVEIGYGH